MGALQHARPDMMNAFNVECKNYGKCPTVETASMAKRYYQFLLATYGRDLTNQLLPELVRLLPDANKRKTILEEVCSVFVEDRSKLIRPSLFVRLGYLSPLQVLEFRLQPSLQLRWPQQSSNPQYNL
jgi:hypothetical protein